MYIWTKKAEDRAKELGLDERKEGEKAMCGYSEVQGRVASAWLEKGYIKKLENN